MTGDKHRLHFINMPNRVSEQEFEDRWGSYLESVGASAQLPNNLRAQMRMDKFRKRYGMQPTTGTDNLSGPDRQLVIEEMGRRGIAFRPYSELLEAAKGDMDPDDSRFEETRRWMDGVESVKSMLPELRRKKVAAEQTSKIDDLRRQREALEEENSLKRARERLGIRETSDQGSGSGPGSKSATAASGFRTAAAIRQSRSGRRRA